MCFCVFIHSNLFNSVFFPLIIETRVVTLTCYETSAFIFQSVQKESETSCSENGKTNAPCSESRFTFPYLYRQALIVLFRARLEIAGL